MNDKKQVLINNRMFVGLWPVEFHQIKNYVES